MNIELLYAFRSLHKVTKVRPQQKLQSEYLKQSYRKLIIEKMNESLFFKYLYLFEMLRIFFFLLLRKNSQGNDNQIIMLAATENQERQLTYIRNLYPEKNFMELNLRGKNPVRFINVLSSIITVLCCFPSALRYYRLFYGRHNFIDYKNYIIFICTYIYAKTCLAKACCKALLVANDHSPIPLGFACAARSLGIKTLYIQHAHITHDLPYLRFDLAILDGQCALNIYKEEGNLGSTEIVYRGLEGEERVMNTSPLKGEDGLTVGLFVNVFLDEKLFEIMNTLIDNPRIHKLIVREHPAFPLDLAPNQIPEGVTLTGRETSLWEDAKQCHLVIGGNSSFHLSVLKYGIPTVFYDDLDFVRYDDYSFIKYDILYEIKELEELDFTKVAKYYEQPKWAQRFQYFDAGYSRKESELATEVRSAIEKLLT